MSKRKIKEVEQDNVTTLRVVTGDFNTDAVDTSHVGLAFWYLRKAGSEEEAFAALEAACAATKILPAKRKKRKTINNCGACCGTGKIMGLVCTACKADPAYNMAFPEDQERDRHGDIH